MRKRKYIRLYELFSPAVMIIGLASNIKYAVLRFKHTKTVQQVALLDEAWLLINK